MLSSTRQSLAKKRHFHVEGQTLFEKPAQKLIVSYGSWSGFQSTFYSVKFNMKCKPNPAGERGRTWSRYFWLKYFLRMVECKELDTNYWQKWVSTDCPSTNWFGRHFFFKGRTCLWRRRQQNTSYSDGKHLKMTNKHLTK